MLANVLQVFPSATFLSRLPDGRLPDRQDFDTFVDEPGERIRRWQQAVSLSHELGKQFEQDIESGRLVDRLEPF